MRLSISTCWNSMRHTDGYDMLKELADLGFEYAELSHGVRLSLVPGIIKAVDEGLIKVSSVHNFCPLPPGVMGAAPNLYQPSGKGRQEKSLWYRHTLKTIDFAHRVKADLMVIHSGSVKFLWGDPSVGLDAAYEKYKADLDGNTYDKVKKKALNKMRKKEKGAIKTVIKNYLSLLPALKEKGVRLGVENREGFKELPLDLEMMGLLKQLGEEENIGYWHDAGHAQIKEEYGLVKHKQLLKENNQRQFGFHLHDVSEEGKDHQEIGSGVIDWEMLKGFIKSEHIVVLELSPKLRTEAILRSRKYVLDLLEGI